MVLDRPRDEDDAFAQQPRINVEAALTPVRLFDDDWDELRNDVLVINDGKRILLSGFSLHRRPIEVILRWGAYIGAKSERFKAVRSWRPTQANRGRQREGRGRPV